MIIFFVIIIKASRDYAGPYGADYPHARIGHSASMIAADSLLMYGGCLRYYLKFDQILKEF